MSHLHATGPELAGRAEVKNAAAGEIRKEV